MPIRHRPDFFEALSTLRRLKNAEYQNYDKIGGKALPRLGGTGKIPGGIPHLRHHHDDGLNTDGAGEANGLLYLWNESQNEFGAKVTVINSVTANAVYCHGRVCKKYTSYYRKLAAETMQIQHEERQEH